jgi:hypothetical protein
MTQPSWLQEIVEEVATRHGRLRVLGPARRERRRW